MSVYGTNYTGRFFGDLLRLDPESLEWTNLTSVAGGSPPSPRSYHGFAQADGRLFVLGGWTGPSLSLISGPSAGLDSGLAGSLAVQALACP